MLSITAAGCTYKLELIDASCLDLLVSGLSTNTNNCTNASRITKDNIKMGRVWASLVPPSSVVEKYF